MNKDKVVSNICTLSINYRTVADKSINDWVKDSGWFLFKKDITTNDIKEYLISSPKLIDNWLTYSDNKRTNGWYFFYNNKDGLYIVGFLDMKPGIKPARMIETSYTDPVEACSQYIFNEFHRFVEYS